MMDIRPLHHEADHEWALAEIERYFDDQPTPGTPEGDRFEVLATLIEAYESKRHPVPAADPVDVLRFAIESLGRTEDELGLLLGSKARAGEILERQEPLTLDAIRSVSAAWRLPIETLVEPYAVGAKV